MLNISIVSHGFHGGAKAMSKTARGYRSQRSCESKKHPAILPWPSGLSRDIDGPVPVSNRQNCILPGKWRRRLCAFADTRAEKPARKLKSAANTKPLDQLFVTSFISAPKVVEYLTALRHELQQPAPRVVVLDVCFEVLGEVGDPLRQQRNLYFG